MHRHFKLTVLYFFKGFNTDFKLTIIFITKLIIFSVHLCLESKTIFNDYNSNPVTKHIRTPQ